MQPIFHALVLNLHQPAGNLEHLLAEKPWEAKEILFALDRMPRALWGYEQVARVHLSLSGTLLETLSNPDFQAEVYGIVKCGDLLWHLQNNKIFNILGTAYYHPVLPLIPKQDWDEQLTRWQQSAQHLFHRSHFPGFWCPEMSFSMELIPHLKKAGYRYVIVDSEYVVPLDPMSWQELRYRPHIAQYQGEEIIVIVRDRQLSDAQESGMEFEWFANELQQRTQHCDFEPLVTTCSDGDNGGWFRNVNPSANFWYHFYHNLLNNLREGLSVIQPTFIDDYLDKYGAYGRVYVRTAAWNTGEHSGLGFVQWTGSQTQREALQRVKHASSHFHAVQDKLKRLENPTPELYQCLEQAHWRLLRAETSCHFFWGDTWVQRCHTDLDEMWYLLQQLEEE